MKKLYIFPLVMLLGSMVAQQPVFPKGPSGMQNDKSNEKLDALFSEDLSDDEELEKKVVTVNKEQVKNTTVIKNAPSPTVAPKPVKGPNPQKPSGNGSNGKTNEKPLNGNWNGDDNNYQYGNGNNWNNGYGNNWNNDNSNSYGYGSTNYGYNEQNSWDGVDQSYYMNNGYSWTGNGYGRFCSYDGFDFYEEVVYQTPHRMVIHRYHPSGSYYLRIVRTYTWIPGGYRWVGGCNTWMPPHWGWRTVKKTRIFTGGYWGGPY